MKQFLTLFALSIGNLCSQSFEPSVEETGPSQYRLTWTGGAQTYFLQHSTGMGDWSFFPEIESGPGNYEYNFATTAEKMFFRLRYTDTVVPNPEAHDFDGDGLTTWEEIKLGGTGTDPLMADTNGDGVRDDGLVYAAEADPDGQGLLSSLDVGLTGRWDFESLNGNQYVNSADNTFPASIGGVVSVDNEGIISKASRFSNNGDWLKINPQIFNQSNTNSIALWFNFEEDWVQNKSTAIASARRTAFWSYNTLNNVAPKLVLSCYKALSNGDRQKIILSTYENGFLNDLLVAYVPHGIFIDDAKWHHLSFVQNSGVASIWLDGAKLGELNIGNRFSNASSTGWFTVGKVFPVPANAINDTNFRGRIDRLRTFSKALSPLEIASLYEQDSDGDLLLDKFEADYRRERGIYFDPPNSDDDQDGLTNLDEQSYGTNPVYYDTDGDLLPDGFEHSFQLDPLSVASPNGTLDDPDGDGLTNLQEVIHSSNPRNSDTDGDGVDDQTEVNQGSFPNDPSDNGQAPPAEELMQLQLSVGDPSDSHSERYYLEAKEIATGKIVIRHQAEDFGVVSSKVYKQFRRGKSYAFSIRHAGTKPDQEEADYDYFSEVVFISPDDEHNYIIIDPFNPESKERATPANGYKVLESARDGAGNPVGTGSNEAEDFKETIEKYQAIFIHADLDIDSNNNEGVVFDEGSLAEDLIEHDPNLPGKVVIPNTGISDGVPDWADGFNINPHENSDDSLSETSEVFTQFLVDIPVNALGLNPDEVEISLNYSDSDPSQVTFAQIGTTGRYNYFPAAQGDARIWTQNTDVRKKESFTASPAGHYLPSGVSVKWSQLADTGSDTIKLFYENIRGTGKREISIDVKILGVNYPAIDIVNTSHFEFEIQEVISDQIVNNECNKLPTSYFGGEGNNPMLMSTRADGKIYMAMRATLVGAVPQPDELLVGMRLVDARNSPLEAETRVAKKPVMAPAVTKMNFSPDYPQNDIAARYEAVWGWDENLDGKLQTGEVLGVFDKTPSTNADGSPYLGQFASRRDLIFVTTESQVNYCKSELEGTWGVFFNPGYAADFIEFFVTGDMDEITDEADASRVVDPVNLSTTGDGLAHPLGAKWNNSCIAQTFRAEFDDGSDLSDDVEDSDTMEHFLSELAKDNKASLATAAPSVGDEGWMDINFTDREMTFSNDREGDLFYALNRTEATGTVKFKVTRFLEGGTQKLDIELEYMNFSIRDTYDFAYGGAVLPRQAAVVQSGFASDHGVVGGGIGKVFFTKIDVEDDPHFVLPDIVVLTP